MKKKRLLTDRSGELHEQILAEKAQQLANEMDSQILREALKELGWHQVVISRTMTYEQSLELDDWIANRIKGRHWYSGMLFLFEDDKDAMWFKLRWLNG